jgi:phosphoglucosamine mutase
LAGLKLAGFLAAGGGPASRLAHVFEPFPQVLINVPVSSKDRLESAASLWEQVNRRQEELGSDGRVLVRASGTEPMVRVMVEARDEASAHEVAQELANLVRRELGESAPAPLGSDTQD